MKQSRTAFALVLMPSLAAALEPYQAPPMVVTRATSLETPAAASTRVIDRDEIERSAASSLIEVLNGKAGIQIRDTLGDGNHASISLRGFGDNAVNNVLVLVDGRRLNNPSLSGPDLNSVPLANIERIEILRGAGTVLYGDQAVGGVVNIITRRPTGNEAYIESTQGSHDLEAYRGHVYQALGDGLSAYVSGETRNTDNYRDHNDASYRDVFGRLRYEHGSGWFLYEYQNIDDELLYPRGLTIEQRRADRKASTSNEWNNSKTDVHRIAGEQALGRHWTANLDYSIRDSDGVGLISGSPFTEGTRVESISPRITGNWDSAHGRGEWLLGFDYLKSDYQAAYALYPSFSSVAEQTQRDWYTQLSQPLIDRVTLSLGYRISEADDRHNGRTRSDSEDSSSVALSWQMNDQTQVFVKREDVLRWANVNENALVEPGIEFLKPQTGESWEAGVTWQDATQLYQASVYRLDLDDELLYAPYAFGGWGANVNLDQTRREGLLLETERELTDRLRVGGQYSFTDSELRAGANKGNEVPWVSRHSAAMHLDYRIITNLYGYLEAIYTGPRYLASDDGQVMPKEGGYTLFNAAVRYEYQDLNVKLRINNLTGKRYDSYSSWQAGNKALYPAPEEDVRLSLGYRF